MKQSISAVDPTSVIVQVEVTDDNQVADGTSKVNATATVFLDGEPSPDVTVFFELIESEQARFLNGDTKTSAVTQSGADGTIKGQTPLVPFTDTLAETGQVYAYVLFHKGDPKSDEKPFLFIEAEPGHIRLELVNDGAAAGDVYSGITARAVVTKNGSGLSGVEVHFQILYEDTSATFRDHLPKPLKLDPRSDAYAGELYSATGTGEPGAGITVSQSGGSGGPCFARVKDDSTFATAHELRAGLFDASGWNGPSCGSTTGAWNDLSASYTLPPMIITGNTHTSVKTEYGVAEVFIQSTVAESGTLVAWADVNNEDKPSADCDFHFSAPTAPTGSSDTIRFGVCPKI